MKKVLYLLTLSLALFVACNNGIPKDAKHENHEMIESNKEVDSDHHTEETQSKVQLDNGKKWKANPETITGVNNMLALVQDGISGKKEATTLYEPLAFEFKTIFEKCTMQGESHTQLHHFLLPLKDDLKKLKNENINTESLKEIQEYLLTFKNYFE